MANLFFKLLLLLFLLLNNSLALSSTTLPYLDLNNEVDQIIESQDIESIEEAINSDDWESLKGETVLGYPVQQHWFRVKVPLNAYSNKALLVEIANPLVDYIDAYLVIDNQVHKQFISGVRNKLSARPVEHRKILFPVPTYLHELENNYQTTQSDKSGIHFYFRISATGLTEVPMRLWPRSSFIQHEKFETLVFGCFFGAMLILSIYHLLLYIRIKKLYILFYGLAVLCIFGATSTRWGFGFEYFWPESPIPSKPLLMAYVSLFFTFFSLFFLYFTGIYRSSRSIRYFYYLLICSFLTIGAISLLDTSIVIMLPTLLTVALVATLSNVVLAIKQWRNGDLSGKYYLLAFTPLLVDFSVEAPQIMGKIPISPFLQYSGSIMVLATSCFLALAVAHKVKSRQEESKNVIDTLNQELEKKVVERTQSLNESLEALKKTQKRLIESEKVAALTGLVSGVAHEINTPIGVGITAASSLKANNDEVVTLFQRNELDRDNMERYFSHSIESLELIENSFNRAAKLVTSFKGIAIDSVSAQEETFNLYGKISKIIALFENTTTTKVPTIDLTCDKTLVITSSPNQIEQLILHLLNNSAHHAFDQEHTGHIYIDVKLFENQLRIQYSDNGKGISDEKIAGIFNPFTTSDRGAGHAGLGTTVIRNIVVQGLKGAINCESPEGSGLTYHIEFPVKVSNA